MAEPLANGHHVLPMQYQRLGKAGIKTSKIILGCMTFGDPLWEGSPWVMSEEESLPLLKKAYDLGINTWDTANTYSNGESERIVGAALRKYDIPRSRVVIMTKLFYPVMDDHSRPQPAINTGPLVNQMGLSRKHIFEAVDASLKRLGTDYIDVLQLHRLDDDTSPEEIMGALHDLVKMGKVLYLGGSSMPCWKFARLQYTAKMNNWATFSSMQGFYNLLYREEEREMNPFCQAEGIGLIPWSPLARGLLAKPLNTVTARSEQDTKAKKWFQGGQQDAEIIQRVEKVAKEKGVSMASVATAWCLHRGACPIVGLNSLERIEKATEALGVELSNSDMQYLEEPYAPLRVQAM
jgi:aryl-alcohol dehydrogenase-like predicted oxidoreductase